MYPFLNQPPLDDSQFLNINELNDDVDFDEDFDDEEEFDE